METAGKSCESLEAACECAVGESQSAEIQGVFGQCCDFDLDSEVFSFAASCALGDLLEDAHFPVCV